MGVEEPATVDQKLEVVRGLIVASAVVSLIASITLWRALLAEWRTKVCVWAPDHAPVAVLAARAVSGVYWALACIATADFGLAITWLLVLGVSSDDVPDAGPVCRVQAWFFAWFPVANGAASAIMAIEACWVLLRPTEVVRNRGTGAPRWLKGIMYGIAVGLPTILTVVLSASRKAIPQFQGVWCWYLSDGSGKDGKQSTQYWPLWMIYAPRLIFFGAISIVLVVTIVFLRRKDNVEWTKVGFFMGFPAAFILTTVFTMIARLDNDILYLTDVDSLSPSRYAFVVITAVVSPAMGLLNLIVMMCHAPSRRATREACAKDAHHIHTLLCYPCRPPRPARPLEDALLPHDSPQTSEAAILSGSHRRNGSFLTSAGAGRESQRNVHIGAQSSAALLPQNSFVNNSPADMYTRGSFTAAGLGVPGSLPSDAQIFAGSFYGSSALASMRPSDAVSRTTPQSRPSPNLSYDRSPAPGKD